MRFDRGHARTGDPRDEGRPNSGGSVKSGPIELGGALHQGGRDVLLASAVEQAAGSDRTVPDVDPAAGTAGATAPVRPVLRLARRPISESGAAGLCGTSLAARSGVVPR